MGYELDIDEEHATQLAELIAEWCPKTPTETLLVNQILVNHNFNNPAKIRASISTLIKLQNLRKGKPGAQINQDIST